MKCSSDFDKGPFASDRNTSNALRCVECNGEVEDVEEGDELEEEDEVVNEKSARGESDAEIEDKEMDEME